MLPPHESEYAVEPVGVAANHPSPFVVTAALVHRVLDEVVV